MSNYAEKTIIPASQTPSKLCQPFQKQTPIYNATQSKSSSIPASTPATPVRAANRFKIDSPSTFIQSIPDSNILEGCVAFVDLWSMNGTDNRSSVFARILDRMGATVLKTFTKRDPVTHLVFKDGHKSYLQKAKKRGIKIVSCLWVERCRNTQSWADESQYLFDESTYNPPKKFREMQPLYPEEEREREERWEKRRKMREEREKLKKAVHFLSPLATGGSAKGLSLRQQVLVPDTPYLSDCEPYSLCYHRVVAETPNENIQKKLQRMREGKPIFSPPSSPPTSTPDTDSPLDVSQRMKCTRQGASDSDGNETGDSPTKCLNFSDDDVENLDAFDGTDRMTSSKSDMDLTCVSTCQDNGARGTVNINPSSSSHDGESPMQLRISSPVGDSNMEEINNSSSSSTLEESLSLQLRLSDSESTNQSHPSTAVQLSDSPRMDVTSQNVVAKQRSHKDLNIGDGKSRRRFLCNEEVMKPASILVSPQHQTLRRSSRRSSVIASKAISAASSGRRKSVMRKIHIDSDNDETINSVSSILPPVGQATMKKITTNGRYFLSPRTSATPIDKDRRVSRRISMSTSYDDNNDKNMKRGKRKSMRKKFEKRRSSSSSSGEKTKRKRTKKKRSLGFRHVKSRRSSEEFTSKMKEPTEKQTSWIVLTSFHREERAELEDAIKRLGGFRVNPIVIDDRVSHVICGAARRTVNVLQAISRGLWLLSKQWVIDSLEVGKWMDEADYEVINYFPVARETRLQRHCAPGSAHLWSISLFSTIEGHVFVSKETQPPTNELQELVTLCGGHVTASPRRASVRVGQLMTSQGWPFVKETWVLGCHPPDLCKKLSKLNEELSRLKCSCW